MARSGIGLKKNKEKKESSSEWSEIIFLAQEKHSDIARYFIHICFDVMYSV